jgi:hypothetical protein
MLGHLSRIAKPISLIAGFLFAVVGSLWSFIVVDRLGAEIKQLSDVKADLRRQIDSLNSIASDYFIANQQGDLIFILAQQSNARQDVANLIYKGNMLDRATPVRNMIGALAIAKQLDYRQAYDSYEKINAEAQSDFSAGNFTRLKGTEKAIITQGQQRVPLLLDNLFQVEKAINARDALQKKNRLLGVVASSIGSFLLLCANLIAMRAESK